MNILFVTVGTTAISNSGIGKPPNNQNNTALQADMLRYDQDRQKDAGRWEKLRRDLVAAHLKYWEMNESDTSNPLNFKQSSAELTSTYRLIQDLGATDPIEKIVLLPTDTAEGRMASTVVLEVMRSPQYGIPVNKDRIVEELIPGLEVTIEELDRRLREAIGKHSRSLHDHRFVNVTGGYKGTSLMFGRLSVTEDLEIYYQHESKHAPVYMKDLVTGTQPILWK